MMPYARFEWLTMLQLPKKKAETLRSHTFSVMPENLKSDNKIKGYPRNICPLGKQEDDLK